MHNSSREQEWATWLRAAIAGDGGAYRRFLLAVTPFLRAMARMRLPIQWFQGGPVATLSVTPARLAQNIR